MRIGVFDSGLGGLTVVKEILNSFQGIKVFYIADTKFAPYGEKSGIKILNQSIKITNYLIKKHNIEVLIVACNTATSAAIKQIREKYPLLLVIGVEPGLKPAINISKSKKVGVMATNATLNGEKYRLLLNELSKESKIDFYEQACIGLVEQIEDGKIKETKTLNMLKNWLVPMKEKGVDTIVFGCTHYPLIQELVKQIMGDDIYLIETGQAIAKRLKEQSSKYNLTFLDEKNEVELFYTKTINLEMINMLCEDYKKLAKISIGEVNE